MPGIHPSSWRQVRYAFAAEARGEFPAKKAREWAHRWKCWTWDESARGKLPKDCKDAIELLERVRTQHPSWKIPKKVLEAERRRELGRVIQIVPPKKRRIAAKKRRAA
jgi:hypothetical protein